MGVIATGSWVSPSSLRIEAPARLFCFAHAGGGSVFFRDWRDRLAPDVAVVPVILPGREGMAMHEPCRRMDRLIEPLTGALASYVDRPFAFFGHSMGAVVAYEAARRLAAQGYPQPLRLFVSGRRAPHLPSDRQPLHLLPDEEFIRTLAAMGGTPAEVLGQRELLNAYLPRLRADFELNETYEPLPGPRLTCPISAFAGDTDTEVDAAGMAAWQDATGGEFVLRLFRGGHFYLIDAAAQLLDIVHAELTRKP